MTPRSLSKLVDRFLEERKREDGQLALLCTLTVNFSACHPEKRATMDDFMPVYGSAPKAKSIPAPPPPESIKAKKQLATAKMRGWMKDVLKVSKP